MEVLIPPPLGESARIRRPRPPPLDEIRLPAKQRGFGNYRIRLSLPRRTLPQPDGEPETDSPSVSSQEEVTDSSDSSQEEGAS